MDDESSGFRIELPELRKYKTLDIAWRLLFILFWISSGILLIGDIEVSRETSLVITGTGVVLAGGFAFYASRKQKTLRPLINRRFAAEFSTQTGYEYPGDIDILEVKRTIAVRRDDGSVLLWGVNRSTGSVTVTPVVQARP
ncbi:hypothetical protein [Paenarthrobacter aurescens]|nr:hypothetical protein [Paenarthrobacter aurescens]MDO6142150.1 hypothetical protein [Paenarthrobacter aurescens]MDO6145998.1 hypothetical protein [Paenarthrobacter aurescens]MDO6157242.1 hypothetical protein [Paenarthrobacter aurescens]MDO6161227.1 hypothetical protein [Paenarthrobacter aurescens]